MKLLLTTLLFLSCSLWTAHAAALPVAPVGAIPPADSTLSVALSGHTPQALEAATGKRPGLLQKLQLKIIREKLRKQVLRDDDKTGKRKEKLSVIALVSIGLGMVTLLAGLWPLAAFFVLGGLIIAIIAASNNESNNKSTNKKKQRRTIAIVAIVLAGALIIFVGIGLIILSNTLGGW